MNYKTIIIVALMAIVAAFILSTYGNASTSASFSDAEQYPNREYQISGDLVLDKPMEYDPLKDPNYFSFYLKDKNGDIKKVVSYEPKPQDFELSDKVVAIGKSKDGNFSAEKLLLKCPSKYEKEMVSNQQ